MGRWEPNAPNRLIVAAVDLFSEQGYEKTSVAEIAARAGLTKTTFFRHFPDKPGVLFGGGEIYGKLMAEAIVAAPSYATTLEAVRDGLDASTDAFSDEQRAFAPRFAAIIAGQAELRERANHKRNTMLSFAVEALRSRGVPDREAEIAGELGVGAFYRAWDRWIVPSEPRSYPDLAREELRQLTEAAAKLLSEA